MVANNDGPWGKDPWGGGQGSSPDDDIDQFIKKGQDKIKQLFPGAKRNGKKSRPPEINILKILPILILVALAMWLSTGFYQVDTKEEALVLRFGKYVRSAGPGLNYHIPSPIEKVSKLKVEERYTEEIGYIASRQDSKGQKIDGSTEEILMLTGDENIVDINFQVQWQISDAKKFLFNVRNPRETVKSAAESAMREVIGTTPINDTLSGGRQAVQIQTSEILQGILDSYDSGIKIEAIEMKAVPPVTVDSAFKDVQAAKINKEEVINKAIAYSNEVIPRAEGQANKFVQVYNEYKVAQEVTKQRMYLETMEQVLKGKDKMILDIGKDNNLLPYLPLNELNKKN